VIDEFGISAIDQPGEKVSVPRRAHAQALGLAWTIAARRLLELPPAV